MLSYTFRRESVEDSYFEYSPQDFARFGEQRIIACTEPREGEFLKWAYIAWGEKGNSYGSGPTLAINVKDKNGDDGRIQRQGLGTALYVLACMQAGKRLKIHPDQPLSKDGKGLAKAMDQINIEGILCADTPPEIVGLHAVNIATLQNP